MQSGTLLSAPACASRHGKLSNTVHRVHRQAAPYTCVSHWCSHYHPAPKAHLVNVMTGRLLPVNAHIEWQLVLDGFKPPSASSEVC